MRLDEQYQTRLAVPQEYCGRAMLHHHRSILHEFRLCRL